MSQQDAEVARKREQVQEQRGVVSEMQNDEERLKQGISNVQQSIELNAKKMKAMEDELQDYRRKATQSNPTPTFLMYMTCTLDIYMYMYLYMTCNVHVHVHVPYLTCVVHVHVHFSIVYMK